MSDMEPNETVCKFKDRLSSIGDIACTSFIGGWGFSINDCQFAISIRDVFYFQVDDELRETLMLEGGQPFTYSHRDKDIVIQRFYSIPDAVMDNQELLEEYTRLALQIAQNGYESTENNDNESTDDGIKKVLMVCTSHDKLGDTGNGTGFWFGELANAYKIFSDANFSITFASPKGGNPPADPSSNSPEFKFPIVIDFEANNTAMASLANSLPLDQIQDISIYDTVMLIGGHGTMWDFPDNKELGRIIDSFTAAGKAIGAVCHGVAGLLPASSETIETLINGRQLTCFSNEEENSLGLTKIVPFLLEDRLKELGAIYSAAKILRSNIIVDGQLITGQNPNSSFGVAQHLVEKVIEDY